MKRSGRKPGKKKPAGPGRPRKTVARRRKPAPARVTAMAIGELETLRAELERTVSGGGVPRWNADPEDVQRSVVRLVLSLVEFLRKLMERQAIRRMEEKTLESDEIERVGTAIMKLEETIHDMARRFHISPEDLNLDLGPLGKLM